jgi:hypothetical protein
VRKSKKRRGVGRRGRAERTTRKGAGDVEAGAACQLMRGGAGALIIEHAAQNVATPSRAVEQIARPAPSLLLLRAPALSHQANSSAGIGGPRLATFDKLRLPP